MEDKIWTVLLHKKVQKALCQLPQEIRERLAVLVRDMIYQGPVRGEWPNYSKLGHHTHHCHLKRGHPTYVAVWENIQGKVRMIEVIYAGSHEKAPY